MNTIPHTPDNKSDTVPVQSTISEPACETEALPVEPLPLEGDGALPIDPLPAPKKKKKALRIALIVLAILIVLGTLGFIFRDFVIAVFMHLMPADMQLKYAYGRCASIAANEVSQMYEQAMEEYTANEDKSVEGRTTFKLSAEALNAMNTPSSSLMYSMLSSGNIALDYRVNMEDREKIAMSAQLTINDQKIIQAAAYVQLDTKILTLDIPEFTDNALTIDLNETAPDIAQILEAYSQDPDKMEALYPDRELLNDLVPSLIKAAFDVIKDVDVKSSNVQAGGVKQDATCFTVEISEETGIQMVIAMLEELKHVEGLEDYLKSLVNSLNTSATPFPPTAYPSIDSDDIYDMFMDAVNDIIDTLEEVDAGSRDAVVLKTWVNFVYDILAIEVDIPQADLAVFLGTAHNNNRYGFELSMKSSGYTVMKLAGDATEENDQWNGSYNLRIDGETVASIDIKDFAKDGSSGTLELQLHEMLLSQAEIPYNSIKLRISCHSTDTEENVTLQLFFDDTLFFSFSNDATLSHDSTITIPNGMPHEYYGSLENWMDIQAFQSALSQRLQNAAA